MTKAAEKLKSELLKLPAKERVRLAEFLFSSIDVDEADELDDAWEQELERRIADLDSARVRAVPWKEVRERLRKKYR
jgi:putative addiction module component (TIGR02574 family)